MDLAHRAKLLAWTRKIVTFLLNQGGIQLLSLCTGLLVLRWMSVESYAQYSVAFGFQGSVGMLIDLGFTGTIIALVGTRIDEPAVIGKYIRSALHFRTRGFLLGLPIGLAVFWWITGRQHWPWPLRLGLFCSVMFTLYYQGWSSCYAGPLMMHQRFGPYYRTQFAGGIFRLLATGALHFLTLLTSVTGAWVNALVMALTGSLYRRYSRDLVHEPDRPDPATNREVIRLAAPTIPPVIFTAFEGQVTLFLVTYFGKSHNIAEVAALGRLTQILLVIQAFNEMVIHPYIARLPRERLLGRYCVFAAAGVAMTLCLWAVSVLCPQLLLFIVGPKYAHLRAELPWSIAGWAMYYLSGLLWAMHSGRRWVFWWHTSLYCVMMVVAQAAGVYFFNLSTTRGILQFGLLGSGASLLVQILGGLYGFWLYRHPEEPVPAPDAHAVDPASGAPAAIYTEEGAPAVLPELAERDDLPVEVPLP